MTALAILFTACGGSSSPTASSGVTTVNWWSWNPGPPLSTQFVDAFNKSHPHIKLVFKNQQYDDYINTLKLAMASGTGPDIFGSQAGAMQREYAQFMEDLTPYAQKTWGGNWQDRFYSFGLSQLATGSTTRSLPFYLSAAGTLWYNKSIFDKYGLQPPKTFDEWVSVSQALQSKGVTPFVQGAKDAWVNYDMYIALSNAIAPGKIYNAIAGKTSWTDSDLVKAMSTWQQMFHNGIIQKGALGLPEYPDANNQFTQGKAAMILLGTWNDSAMTKTGQASAQSTLGVKDKFQFLPLAFPTLNGQSTKLFGGPDVALAMNKDSKVKDAAWQVLSWLTSQDAQVIHSKAVEQPSIKGLSIDDSDVISDAQKSALKAQGQDLNTNIIGPREIPYPELKTALADALQNVASGTQSPQQAMAAIDKASQSIQR
jgi:raffinose/stachyose/melibiose transport system substrate-binding protein